MRKVEIGVKNYTFYDSIKETPEYRWQKAQVFLAHESGIGSTLESVNTHYARFFQYISAGKLDMLAEESNNLFFNWNSVINSISYKSLFLTAFVHSVNGKVFNPVNDEDYFELHRQLLNDGITNGMLDDLVEEIKKKLLMN